MSLLEISGVAKAFRQAGSVVQACRDVHLSVAPGEVVGLVGESGSGKSTLANLVLGLLAPDAGEIRFDGRPLESWLTEGRGYRAAVQAVFQQPLLALDRRRTVGWSIAEPLVVHKVGDRASRDARVLALLDQVGLEPALANRLPRQLSGGQLQRVNIARALALEPRLLVCDEPVSALDVSVQAQILNLFLDIQERSHTAMLFVAHDLAVVRHLADRIAVMYAGRIVEQGPPDELCSEPLHPYTGALIAASPEVGFTHEPLPLRPREGLPDHGCRFAPRCPYAEPACGKEVPPLRTIEPSRAVACRRAEELREDRGHEGPQGVGAGEALR
jgi:oligopeptide/dipeptide ABC transporter ATP-binding protein